MRLINKILLKIFGVRLLTSQNGEDLIIESLIPEQKTGFYIDIGANHPIKLNNTFLFYSKGWNGINIEPNPSRLWMFRLLRKRDKILNVGIGEKKSVLPFYIFTDDTLSTFDKDIADKYQKMGHPLKKIQNIDIVPLADILNTYACKKEIDILSLDTEGMEMVILKSNDWDTYRPRFIILETLDYERYKSGKKTNNIYDPYMESIGYTKIADTNINSIYTRKY